jgi:hypothetical protein
MTFNDYFMIYFHLPNDYIALVNIFLIMPLEYKNFPLMLGIQVYISYVIYREETYELKPKMLSIIVKVY